MPAGIASLTFVQACCAQSSIVHVPVGGNSVPVSATDFGGETMVPFSMSSRARSWEHFLSQPHRQINGPMTVKELLSMLAQIGVPVYLDQSAIDDQCDSETKIVLDELPYPLYQRLDNALSSLNAELVLFDNQFSIISRDIAGDPEYFCTLTYDVSGMDADPYELVRLITSSINPDDWDDSNGDGVLEVLRTNGRRLLVISQSYPVHLRIRQLFDGISRTIGVPSNSPVRPTEVPGPFSNASSSVTIPQTRSSQSPHVIQNGQNQFHSRSGGVF